MKTQKTLFRLCFSVALLLALLLPAATGLATDTAYVSLSAKAATTSLAAPVLTGASNVNGGVQVSWKASAGAVRYAVFRKVSGGSWVRVAETAATATSYTDTSAVSGTKYTYTVRCVSSDGKAYESSYDSTGKTVTYIAAPVLTGASNVNGGVQVSWKTSAGAVRYAVFRKVSGGSWVRIAETAATSYTDTSAVSGAKYTYTVRCVSSDGKAYESSYNSTGLTLTYIAAPVLNSASNVNGGVQVSWKASAGAARYAVFRKVSGGSWVRIAETTATSYTDTSAASGTKYTYTVRCVSSDGKTYQSSYNSTGLTLTYIAAPVLNSVSNVSGGVQVSWKASAGAARYAVFRKVSGGSWVRLAETTATSHTDTSAAPGTKYTYTVRCVSSDGKTYQSSYNSTGLTITTAPSAPAYQQLTVGGKTYYLGQAASALGTPDETLASAYSFTWYLYGTQDYKNFLAAGVYNNTIVALASGGPGFTYMGASCGSQWTTDLSGASGCTPTVVLDSNDNNILHAVQIIHNAYYISSSNYTSTVLAAESKMNFHFTNAFRVYHGLAPLRWSANAAKAAQLHSQDMADQNYFAHYSQDGRTPWERMEAQGVSYFTAGENINAGYSSGFYAYNGWVNSSGHRANMLGAGFTYLGVGGGYNAGSTYRIYFTQDFYG